MGMIGRLETCGCDVMSYALWEVTVTVLLICLYVCSAALRPLRFLTFYLVILFLLQN